MIYENLKNSFRIYDNIAKQTRFLKPGEVNSLFGLICPYDGVLPWQMLLPGVNSATVTSMQVMKLDDTVAYDLEDHIPSLDKYQKISGGLYIVHTAKSMGLTMSCGAYYIRLIIDGLYYFSEVFTVVDCISWDNLTEAPYLLLKYNNDCGDLGPLLYQTGWQDFLFLDTILEKEEPGIYEEGAEDALKNFTAFLQKYVDNLSFDVNVPFHLVETLVLISMHKNVELQTTSGLYSGKVRNMKTTVGQTVQNIYAVNVKFQQDTVYVNTGCCDKIPIINLECLPPVIAEILLPEGVAGVAYSATIPIAGTGPFTIGTFIVPDWMTVAIVGSNFVLTGAPETEDVGTFSVDLSVENTCGSDAVELTSSVIASCVPVQIAEVVLPDAVEAVPYSFNVPITGSTPYNIGSITKPDWMAVVITGSNFVLTGTPGVGDAGAISATLKVSNACGTYTRDFGPVVCKVYVVQCPSGIGSWSGVTCAGIAVSGPVTEGFTTATSCIREGSLVLNNAISVYDSAC